MKTSLVVARATMLHRSWMRPSGGMGHSTKLSHASDYCRVSSIRLELASYCAWMLFEHEVGSSIQCVRIKRGGIAKEILSITALNEEML